MYSLKSHTSLRLSLGVLSCLAHSLTAAPTAPASAIIVPNSNSTAAWTIQADQQDTISMEEKDGVLQIDYSVAIEEPSVVYEKTRYKKSFYLNLKNPVPAVERKGRVVFEARGQDGSTQDRRGTVFIHPVLEDAHGERFSYEPYRVGLLERGEKDDWAQWTTRPFLAGEAGGAVSAVYTASGGDKNRWPDGELQLVGFEIQLQNNSSANQPGTKNGTIYLGRIQLETEQVTESAPWTYLDTLLDQSGDFELAWEVSPAFQALPVSEQSIHVNFDAEDEASRKQVIRMPEAGKWSNSWIRYQIRQSKSHNLVHSGAFRWEVNQPVDANPPITPADPTQAPVIGYTRINPDKNGSGVYTSDEAFQAHFRIFSDTNTATQLQWTLNTYAYKEIIEKGDVSLKAESNDYQDIWVDLPRPAGHNAFRLEYALLNAAGNIVDSGSHVLGIQLPKDDKLIRAGVIPHRDKIKQRPYNRITFHDGHSKKGTADILERFRHTLEEAGTLTRHITFMIDLAEFQILPGVYDFNLPDQILNTAADYGYGVTIRLAHAESKTPYLWLPYTRVRDFDGSVIEGHYVYHAFSMADGSYKQNWIDSFRALYDRYQDHSGFEGYYLMKPNGEWVLPEEIWYGKVADYSWRAERAFKDYLRKTLALSLEDLNQRWDTDYDSWEAVQQPKPMWELGSTPDLRAAWKDFSEFKQDLQEQWCIELGLGIREFDQNRIIISYGAPSSLIAKDGSKPIDYGHNGGNNYLKNEGKFIKAWDQGKGTGWVTEPHHPHRWAAYGDPGDMGWILDWSVFVMSAQAGGGGANLHVYYHPNPSYDLAAHFGGEYAYDRMLHYKHILAELHGLKIVEPIKQVATFYDPFTIMTKHRTTFHGREADMTRWFELLTQDSVPSESFREDKVDNYKVILSNPLDQVLSDQSVDTLTAAVRNGATLITGATTGRYSASGEGKDYPLLRSLGIPLPAGDYTIRGESIRADVLPAFQEALGRENIAFYTQDDMRRELESDEIAAHFTQWPYRWIPESDYFGYFAHNDIKAGEILAHFPDGGVALSKHQVGKGNVLVFWGTPDTTPKRNDNLLGKLSSWLGVTNPQADNPIPYMLEGEHLEMDRNYALLYQPEPGTYQQNLPNLPDGKWFVDELNSGDRLGYFDGATLRQSGIELDFEPKESPLKILRFIPAEKMGSSNWLKRYPDYTK
ncbi:alpha-amylase family protein [Coraliomargarita algicola]|uniref:Alpha-amylase family protein n=1 Tax=Coraliomargarita algicola TaxID=3092156 RepID=A0ABZ0RP69_9BACT|nr:alpha-amylase family protein [Coraliomargarita sp. J2-16]WPJ96697.1 alpha-amylase family protein [Coraliomargarita sp. J2-16]